METYDRLGCFLGAGSSDDSERRSLPRERSLLGLSDEDDYSLDSFLRLLRTYSPSNVPAYDSLFLVVSWVG